MTISETNASNIRAKPGKHLTFFLGQELFGLPVLKVREIIRMVSITPVPRMPAYVKGVINLRGKLVPVMDLRVRFSHSGCGFTERTCIVVAQVNSGSGTPLHMGFIVDGVREVIHLASEDIEATPDFGASLPTEYLLGMANVKDKVIALLDIDQVIDKVSLDGITHAGSEQNPEQETANAAHSETK